MKCQGVFGFLFGHKFEGFYDEESTFPNRGIKATVFDVRELMETRKTFVKAVCKRCGEERLRDPE